jgi:hypothetical protein
MTLEALLYQKIKGLSVASFTPPKREYGESFSVASNLMRDFPTIFRSEIAAFGFWQDRIKGKKPHLPWRTGYTIMNQEVHFIIDGMDLDYFYDDGEEVIMQIGDEIVIKPSDRQRYAFIKPYLEFFTAADITGIELMINNKFTGVYNSNFEQNRERIVTGRNNAFAYIEITTRAGKGPFMNIIPGTYLHKTLAYTLPKQFYSPKYTIANKNVAIGTDMRPTLHWAPNVITNIEGKATVSFFTADKPAGYTIIMEGLTPEGEIGFGREKIKKAMP